MTSIENMHGDEKNKILDTEENRYLCFSLGKEDYAIPLLKVKEVIAVPDFTPVPYTPVHFMGIMNLRGQVISSIDLKQKFGMPKAPVGEESAIIIVDLAPVYLGVLVDSVNTVLSLSGAEVKPPPEIESKRNTDYIIGVAQKEKNLILILDIAKALDFDDFKAIRGQVSKTAA
jgi:purine-binding chemotaxis protein CheW